MVKVDRRSVVAGAALFAFSLPSAADAQQAIKIGVLYPLSGNAASAGNIAKTAIELGADLVNKGDPELGKLMPIAKGGGLSGLNGAKIELVVADNQGTPAAGQNQALRLITQEKVVAILGAYQSGITQTASAVAEKYGVPFLTPESTAADLTERGYKWFFRTTPIATNFAKAYSDFLKQQKAAGRKVDSIAIVYENTEYGKSTSTAIADLFAREGLNIAMKVPYSANSTDVQPQVLQLKEKSPDVVIFISYTSDAILYAKTMKSLNWKPEIMVADDSGFNDPAFVKSMGSEVEGLISRSVFAPGKPGSIPAIADALYRKKSGNDLEDGSARALQGFLVLVDAINRAKSTDPAKVREALVATDMKADQMVAGYNGVKFDAKGQNTLGSSLVIQMHGGKYVAVWPKEKATADISLPYKGWTK
ncbi:ABC transporter substrate-binding protein [Reyranella sp.]|jgi:branched-chain amino acid transport system substrate-binding protein|uniref:ABC transporter substrate-binding protein n=1 Tax=Reyranella sp. TaxID=1929291 RepID=UPI002F92B257